MPGNICTDITGDADGWRSCQKQRKRVETAYLNPVSWKLFRLGTLMRIWCCDSFNKQQKLMSAVGLMPHTWPWKSGGLYLNTATCGSGIATVLFQWPLGWKSRRFLILDDLPKSACFALHPPDFMMSSDGWMKPMRDLEIPPTEEVVNHPKAINTSQIRCFNSKDAFMRCLWPWRWSLLHTWWFLIIAWDGPHT